MLERNGSRNGGSRSRWATALGGTALLLYAVGRPTRMSLLVGATGAALLYRGTTGQSPVTHLMEEVGNMTNEGVEVHRAVTIQRTPEDVYRFWRGLENLPRFMEHLESVEELDETRSLWKARMTGGLPLSWEAVIVRDNPGEVLEWRTEPDSTVEHFGQVRFVAKDNGQTTQLHVHMVYRPPLGAAGAAAAQLLSAVTEQQIKEEIRNCKRLLEAGEIPTTEGQPSGRVRA